MNVRKVFVITGGAKGIGKCLVDRFVASCAVSTCDVLFSGPAFLDDASCVYRHAGDVSQESDVRDFVQATVDQFGRIDCLINNAAVANPYMDYGNDDNGALLEQLDMDQFQRVIQTNLVGPMLMAKYCAPHLRKTKGCIINISSTRARMSEPYSEAYAASKGGVEALTHSLAISLQKDEVRVNAVAPGWIHVAEDYTPTAADDAFHPVGRVGKGDDIFGVCEFLSDSTKSGFITGQTITVDGGVTKKMIYPEEE
eukprot:scaffold296_cov102-Amphora_coffeaeformis.AAC.21